ncbi:pilus assembly protein Flp/PilA [Selenomonas sp. GACV-9]|uniref:pilin protein n=1 Tax=Selenomonas sp. GACV-9 TaxID=3158782 RepID=UPI0008EAA91B|nr:pilus assembly protein Flp/PilA [Selenomonas ruminantium]
MLEILDYLKARYVSEKAQGIVEYALVLAFVVVVAVALGTSGDLTNKVKEAFTNVTNAFASKSTGQH